MGKLLRYLLHALIVWIMMRGLVSLAITSGTQSLWAIAAATATTIAVSAAITAWLTRTHRSDLATALRLLLPVPLLGGIWAGLSAWTHHASGQQVAVAAGAWIVGGLLGAVLVQLVWRKRRRRPEMRTSFA